MKRYRITVEEIGQEKQIVGAQWERGTDPEHPEKFGYTPEVEATRDYRREVFHQTVEELDMPAFVSVINNITQ